MPDDDPIIPAPVEATSATDVAEVRGLSAMIAQAAAALAGATTPAQVLDAAQRATFAYDAAGIAGRLLRARNAHAEIMAACRKAQGDAIEIEAQAQVRLADEYDAAQDRGEAARPGEYARANIPTENISPTVTEIGLTSKIVHKARQVRDAERRDPGIIRRTVAARLDEGEAPTHADIRRAIAPPPRIIPTTTFTPAAPAPPQPEADGPISDYDADLNDEHLGGQVYAGVYPDGEVRISGGTNLIFLRPDALRNLVDWIEDNDLLRVAEPPQAPAGEPATVPDIEDGRIITRPTNALDDEITAAASMGRITLDNFANLVARQSELTMMQRQGVANILWTAFETAKGLHDGFLSGRWNNPGDAQ